MDFATCAEETFVPSACLSLRLRGQWPPCFAKINPPIIVAPPADKIIILRASNNDSYRVFCVDNIFSCGGGGVENNIYLGLHYTFVMNL